MLQDPGFDADGLREMRVSWSGVAWRVRLDERGKNGCLLNRPGRDKDQEQNVAILWLAGSL